MTKSVKARRGRGEATAHSKPAAISQTKVTELKTCAEEKKSHVTSSDARVALCEKLEAARGNIGMFSQPLRTLRLFVQFVAAFLIRHVVGILRNPVTWFVVVPAIATWVATKRTFAPHLFARPNCGVTEAGPLWYVELIAKEVVWWVGLGVLSSVGFGTGLHSGLMFLFPHVMQVVGAAESCRTTMGLVTWYQHPCKCNCATTYGPKDDSSVTFLRLWLLVMVPCMLWGAGTALGELPPYMISKAARLSGKKDANFELELETARASSDAFSRMKIWTIDFTRRHGFVGVFLLASWPNAAFDMCGMCCGYLAMSFWTFFPAVLLGKGVVKVNGQAVVFVNLFSSHFFKLVLKSVDACNSLIQAMVGRDFGLRRMVETGRAKLIFKFAQQARFSAAALFKNGTSTLGITELKALYATKVDDGSLVARRVLSAWDEDEDGHLSLEELDAASSLTDNKISLGSLDPGTGRISKSKLFWEAFIVCLVVFFVVKAIDEAARNQQAQLDDAELAAFDKAQKTEFKRKC
jgi:membrane protein YqaA with SNARE-associated domain